MEHVAVKDIQFYICTAEGGSNMFRLLWSKFTEYRNNYCWYLNPNYEWMSYNDDFKPTPWEIIRTSVNSQANKPSKNSSSSRVWCSYNIVLPTDFIIDNITWMIVVLLWMCLKAQIGATFEIFNLKVTDRTA